MISCLTLERPGKWRTIGITMLFLIAALPAAPLLWRTVTATDPATAFVGDAFVSALQNSAVVALLVAVVALLVGLPAGVLTALYEFPGRRVLLALTTLPLLVPSFLWAIGWSALAARLGPLATNLLSGFTGCFLVLSAVTVPLVLSFCCRRTRPPWRCRDRRWMPLVSPEEKRPSSSTYPATWPLPHSLPPASAAF